MTGREMGFLLLGFMIGIIVTIVYQFIRGFFKWRQMNIQQVGRVDLEELGMNEGISLRIARDENGQFHIEELKEESEKHAEDSDDRTADNVDETGRHSAREDTDSESLE